MNSHYDIVIVGGGLAGLALAAALRETSWRIAIVEASEVRAGTAGRESAGTTLKLNDFEPRVSALSVASIDFLRQCGVWERVSQARHALFKDMYVWDAEGSGHISFSAAEVGEDYLGSIVENQLVLQALRAELAQSKNVSVLSPFRVRRLQLEQGSVVELDDGRALHAQLVVAADGGNSSLREMAGLRSRAWSYKQRAVVANVQTELPHQSSAWQRFLATGPLAFLPLPGGGHYSSIVWSLEEDQVEQITGLADEDFCAALGAAFENRLGQVLAVSPRFSFPLRQIHAVDYVKPGFALLGDAAHVIHPLAGQGINLGFQDARVLAEELRRGAARGLSLEAEQALRRYQRRRKSDNLRMMAVVESFNRLFSQTSLSTIWLRNAGMRQLNQMQFAKQRIVRQAIGF